MCDDHVKPSESEAEVWVTRRSDAKQASGKFFQAGEQACEPTAVRALRGFTTTLRS